MTYKLYYVDGTASMGVRVLLEEIGAPYELIQTTTERHKPRPAKQLKLNPNGWVPVLLWDDSAMYECAAENAKKVAAFLSKNKRIKLLYPFKKNSQNFRMWKKYYSGASGLMGLKIKAKNINSVRKFVNSLKLFGYGYSWGGFESLALHQEFRETGKRKYMNLPKDEHLVRLHIGLEDPNDLIADIKQALRHLR